MQLLVRNKVKDFAIWHDVFVADLAPAAEYGLKLVSLWRSTEDPNNVFFCLTLKISNVPTRLWRGQNRKRAERSLVCSMGSFTSCSQYKRGAMFPQVQRKRGRWSMLLEAGEQVVPCASFCILSRFL